MAASFATDPRRDRAFFLAFVVVGWFVIVMGFWESVLKRWQGHADFPAPPILVAHIAAFVGWMALLTAQMLLIRFRRHRLHQRIGLALVALAPVMVTTGIGAEIASQRFYSPRYPENLRFFAFPVAEMAMFIALAAAAFLARRDSPAHKRLILLATSTILAAATNRWTGQALYLLVGDGFWGMFILTYAGPNVLIAAALLYDLAAYRSIHRVYRIAVPAILAVELISSAVYHAAWWPGVVRGLVGLPAAA